MASVHSVPENRVRTTNAVSVRADGRWVVYWMTAYRRTRYNFALQRARDWARQLARPLIVLESLPVGCVWASHRFHDFIIQGMRDNAHDFAKTVATYYPFVEAKAGQGSGLLGALAKDACLVVSDEYPCLPQRRQMESVSDCLPAHLELVDSNCLMPMRALERTFTMAHSYRRVMQKTLPTWLEQSPQREPLSGRAVAGIPRMESLPRELVQRWPVADLERLLEPDGLAVLEIDHSVAATTVQGGSRAAGQRLRRFLKYSLPTYGEDRNQPDLDGGSRLSPYLHFGHISAHEVFWSLMNACQWHPGRLSEPNGSAGGFWNVGSSAEAFLDQLCTWREIGFNMCWREPNYDRYESLPAWARTTLDEHACDERPHIYSYEELEQSLTADPLWNATQRQLVRDGHIHNYLRMLWGKKILEWTESPELALETMIKLNDKFALDGRDPNSYSGIFWVLGRYDRPWGPERPVFGKVRYMSSACTRKKLKLKKYLAKYQ